MYEKPVWLRTHEAIHHFRSYKNHHDYYVIVDYHLKLVIDKETNDLNAIN